MFAFAKRTRDSSLTAIIPQQGGMSIASIRFNLGHKSMLNACEFIPWDSAKSQQRSLQAQAKKYGLLRKPCTTLLAIGDYSVLSVEAPDVPHNELKQAIRWQIKDLIDFHIDDAVLDVFDAPASGADGRQRNLYVVVTRASTVQQRIKAMQEVDINLTTIDVPELVLRNITAQLPEDAQGVAMVYLEQDRGLLVLTRNKTLYLARVLDMGYQDLQQAKMQSTNYQDETVELNPVYDRLVLELQRSMDYYDRYFVQAPISSVVFAPTPVEIPGLTQYVSSSLGVAARNLDLNEIINSDKPIEYQQQADCLLAIAAAMRVEKKTL